MTDPALVRVWPKKWLNDPEIVPAIRYLDRYLHDFKVTTESSVTTTVNRDAYDSTIGMVFGQPGFDTEPREVYTDQRVEVKSLICKTISNETFTAVDNMFINMTNTSTLLLPSNPCENCVINFTKDATVAIIDGNGKKVNGRLDRIVFRKERLARQIHYFLDADEWFFI